jgi:hypothetical protein
MTRSSICYRFVSPRTAVANRSGVPASPPITQTTTRIEAIADIADAGGAISERDAQWLANLCYGVMSGFSPIYRHMGWAWDITGIPGIHEWLVEDPFNRGNWRSYYAATERALRLVLDEGLKDEDGEVPAYRVVRANRDEK